MEATTTTYTRNDFFRALDQLTDEQLTQPAYFWGENCGGTLRNSYGDKLTFGALHMGLFSMTEKQRQLPYTHQIEGESVLRQITGITILEEDYINPSGESCEPISHYIKGHPNCQAEDKYAYSEEELRADNEVVYPAGTVIIELY